MFGQTFSGSNYCCRMEATWLAAEAFDGARDRDSGDNFPIRATDRGRDRGNAGFAFAN
jgi:hypothetical protein